jgi:hypothetical protein
MGLWLKDMTGRQAAILLKEKLTFYKIFSQQAFNIKQLNILKKILSNELR